MSLLSWLKQNTARDDAWITVHPNAGGKGSPVLLDDEGYIKGGMGGKFTGQRIDLMPRKNPGLRHEVSGFAPNNQTTSGFLRTYRYKLKAPQEQGQNTSPKEVQTQSQNVKITPQEADKALLSMGISPSAYPEQQAIKIATVYKPVAEAISNSTNTIAEKMDMNSTLDFHMKRIAPAIYYEDKGEASSHKLAMSEAQESRTVINNIRAAAEGRTAETQNKIGSTLRGTPMTPEQADETHANPNYSKDPAARINCQTCVLAYEARLRGFDVTAKGKEEGNISHAVSRGRVRDCFFDPKTGLPPQQKQYSGTVAGNIKKLTADIGPNERGLLRFKWKDGGGHVVNVDKTPNGELRIIDAQSGKMYTGDRLKGWLKGAHSKGLYAPLYVRTDNMYLNTELGGMILNDARK